VVKDKGAELVRRVLWQGMIAARALGPVRSVLVWIARNYPQALGRWPDRYAAYRSMREDVSVAIEQPQTALPIQMSRARPGPSSSRLRRAVHQLVLGDFTKPRRKAVATLAAELKRLGLVGRCYIADFPDSDGGGDRFRPLAELPIHDDCVVIIHYTSRCVVPNEVLELQGAKLILVDAAWQPTGPVSADMEPSVANRMGSATSSPPPQAGERAGPPTDVACVNASAYTCLRASGQACKANDGQNSARSAIRDETLELLAHNEHAGISRNSFEALALKHARVAVVFDVGADFERLSHALVFAGSVPPSTCAAAPKATDGSIEFVGHVNGSYSLARITRSLALGAERLRPGRVRIVSREGSTLGRTDAVPADVLPEIRRLVDRTSDLARPIVSISHHYPPAAPTDASDLCLVLFPWEEGLVPPDLLRKLEHAGDAVLAVSPFVKKVLIDSGIRRPVYDFLQAPDLSAFWGLNAERNWPRRSDRFVFLHVSSCLPRKGVDLLLAAYAAAFTRDDPVELVVKGFPNPHNDVDAQIAKLRARHSRLAPLTFINEDADDRAILDLYRAADAVVLPTRGEGFNLPASESFAAGVPVITTGGGGHLSFCDEQTAWLIPYRFAYSQSHLASTESVWLEPDVEELASVMRRLFEQSRTQEGRAIVAARVTRARERVEECISIERWLQGVARAADALIAHPPIRKRIRVAWVSTWRTRCGIAEYSRFMLESFKKEDFDIGVFGDERTPEDNNNPAAVSFALRSWQHSIEGWRQHCTNVARFDPDVIVLQHNWGLFGIFDFAAIVTDPRFVGAVIVLVMHNTQEMESFSPLQREAAFRAFRRADRILVHTLHDLNRMMGYGFADRTTLFPHGVLAYDAIENIPQPRQAMPIIGSYGFFMPHKGLDVLIQALPIIRKHIPGARLRLVNAEYPSDSSRAELARCRRLAERLDVSRDVKFISDFLSISESLRQLRDCDVLAFPYQQSTESASGAARLGLAAGRPVATTPISIFDELGDARVMLPGISPAEVARGLTELLSDRARQAAVLERQLAWMRAREWSRMAERLGGVLEALMLDSRYGRSS
jgi:glycosyltransferase involved in cell wall biosynthesis